jgi:selenocysteine-specific elongation factor
MTVVVGTAGHIDHGKTALLRELTGIDADRLPEERRRGMTIDVGYAHLGLPDGSELDFVDVPGHDRLVGNMLVGAGEIDAVMLVVAADDGPRAQTLEHLELLDALGLRHGIAVVTKIDLVDDARVAAVREAVDRLLTGTALAGSPILEASSANGRGIDAVGAALLALRDRVLAAPPVPVSSRSRLAVDRVFSVKGRGLVVTGTLRGGSLARNVILRLVPSDREVRSREIQVHGRSVARAEPGRTAINVAGVDPSEVHRGMVFTDDPAVAATDRILVRLTLPMSDRTRVRLHLGTTSVDGVVGRAGRDAIDLPDGKVAAVLRLAASVAAAAGDRFVLRRETGADRIVGGIVLDATPPWGISRRRHSPPRLGRLAAAIEAGDFGAVATARLDLHGALGDAAGRIGLAEDVADAVAGEIVRDLVAEPTDGSAAVSGLAEVRAHAARALRRLVTLRRDQADAAANALIERLAAEGRIVRDGELLHLPGAQLVPAAMDPALALAMDRLERALAVPAPPALSEAARLAGCPPAGIRELERSGRIVLLERELAWTATTYRQLEALALGLASRAPLTPATLRDATGTSRKYVMAILADLDRREILRRIEEGHVPGPRAATVTAASTVTAGRAGAGPRTVPAPGPAGATTATTADDR